MSAGYKATCGCEIHVAQWTSKRKLVSQKSCPLHKSAKDLLEACKLAARNIMDPEATVDQTVDCLDALEAAINKAEGR